VEIPFLPEQVHMPLLPLGRVVERTPLLGLRMLKAAAIRVTCPPPARGLPAEGPGAGRPRAPAWPLGLDRNSQVHVDRWFTRACLRVENHTKKRPPRRWEWGSGCGGAALPPSA